MKQVALCETPWTSRDGSLIVGGYPLRVLKIPSIHRENMDKLLAGDTVPITRSNAGLIHSLQEVGIVRPVYEFTEDDLLQISQEIQVVFAITGDPIVATQTFRKLLEGNSPFQASEIIAIAPNSEAADKFTSRLETIEFQTVIAPLSKMYQIGLMYSSKKYLALTTSEISIHPEGLKLLALAQIEDSATLIFPRIIGAPCKIHCNWQSSLISHFEEKYSLVDKGGYWSRIESSNRVSGVSGEIVVIKTGAAFETKVDFATLPPTQAVRELASRVSSSGLTALYEPGVIARQNEPKNLFGFLATAYDQGLLESRLTTEFPYSKSTIRIEYSHLGAIIPPVLLGPKGLMATALAGAVYLAKVSQRLAGTKGSDIAAVHFVAKSSRHSLNEIGLLIQRSLSAPLLALLPFSKIARRALLVGAAFRIHQKVTSRDMDEFVPTIALNYLQDISFSVGLWIGAVKHRNISAIIPKILRSQLTSPNRKPKYPPPSMALHLPPNDQDQFPRVSP